jgi:hypothetical protein
MRRRGRRHLAWRGQDELDGTAEEDADTLHGVDGGGGEVVPLRLGAVQCRQDVER